MFTVRLTEPFTYTMDRADYCGPLNFGTEPNQKVTEDRTGPDRIDRAGLGRSIRSRRKIMAGKLQI